MRYGLSAAAITLTTVGLVALGHRINATTVALVLLVVVLAIATSFGRNAALLASFGAMLSFNFFFLPPVRTWHIADSQNLVAWAAFTLTAIIAGELSAYARRRAKEAERLYDELQVAFAAATEAEALKQSEKFKSALLDAVTHDLRTPLTSIKASVTTLLDSEGGHRTIELDSDGRAVFLDIINEETDRLNKFIEGMIELARLEAGNVGTSEAVAGVEEIVAMVLERAQPFIAKHEVRVDVPGGLPAIRGEARALAEVLYNLLENAAKYSPPGTVIKLAAESADEGVRISVNDQGPGIPGGMRERIFEKFVRLSGSGTTGLGLGLAIAKGIAEAQGAALRAEAGDDGVGAKLVLTVSVAKPK
jgi:two-component system sensor histidine kinase KdpD